MPHFSLILLLLLHSPPLLTAIRCAVCPPATSTAHPPTTGSALPSTTDSAHSIDVSSGDELLVNCETTFCSTETAPSGCPSPSSSSIACRSSSSVVECFCAGAENCDEALLARVKRTADDEAPEAPALEVSSDEGCFRVLYGTVAALCGLLLSGVAAFAFAEMLAERGWWLRRRKEEVKPRLYTADEVAALQAAWRAALLTQTYAYSGSSCE